MEIQFDEASHKYTRNNTEYISVTTLLKKYNLSANYANIPEAVLKNAAKRGSQTHKDLELYIKNGTDAGTADLQNFKTYVTARQIDLSTALSEQLYYDDTYKIAGTVDFQYYDDKDFIVADFKTTSSIHWESVAWQLSIYNYMICKGDIIQYYTNKLKVIHLYNNKFTVKEVPIIDYDEVVKLLTANLTDAPYTYHVDLSKVISNSEGVMLEQVMSEIAECTTLLEELNAKKEKMQERIKTNMEAQNLHQFSIGNLSISYTDEGTRKNISTAKLKEFCDKYDLDIEQFYNISTTKSRVNIKVR